MSNRIGPRIGVVAAVALLGTSFAKLLGEPIWEGALAGTVMGLTAILISLPFAAATAAFEKDHTDAELLGMRLGTIGLCIALAGWLAVVFVSYALGFPLVVVGVAIGVAGALRHLYVNFAGRDDETRH